MKKKLEAELISIAHRVLKIHNREEIVQLQKEALNLYEKLSILRFYEENFEPTKPTIGRKDLEFAIENKDIMENTQTVVSTNEVVLEIEPEVFIEDVKTETPIRIEENEMEKPEATVTFEELQANGLNEEEPQAPISVQILDEIENDSFNEEKKQPISEIVVEEKLLENSSNISATTEDMESKQNLVFENKVPEIKESKKSVRSESELENFNYLSNLFSGFDDTFSENKTPKKESDIKSSFESLLGQNYQELEFVKADLNTTETEVEEKPKKVKKEKKTKEIIETTIFEDAFETSSKSVSEIYSNTITLGLNDRIAFQMHLFNDSDQDLNRVVSQLNTMNNKDEALDFIHNMVKPDYNNWEGKEEFEKRFMALVEKRFS